MCASDLLKGCRRYINRIECMYAALPDLPSFGAPQLHGRLVSWQQRHRRVLMVHPEQG